MRIKKTSQYIEGGAGLPSYFTDEIDTGMKWIDGKPIYRKVIQTTMPTYTSGNAVDKYISLDNVAQIISINSVINQVSGSDNYAQWALPFFNPTGGLMAYVNYKWDYYSTAEGKNSIAIKSNVTWLSGCNINIVVEYTKTTD